MTASAKQQRITLNITLRIGQDMVAALMQNQPKLKAVPLKRDWRTRQAARFAQDLLDWSERKLKLRKLREQMAYWLFPTGNVFAHVGWDYAAGRRFPMVGADATPLVDEGGQPIVVHEGEMTAFVVSPFSAYWHPHAIDLDASPYFIWRMVVSRSWLKRHFPSHWKAIDSAPSISENDQMYDASLLSFMPGAGGGRSTFHPAFTPDDEDSFCEMFAWYCRPTQEYERGRLAYCLGSKTQMTHTLYDSGDQGNPHCYFEDGQWQGGIPFVHAKWIPIPGSFIGANPVDQIRDPQMEINKRTSQAAALANSAAIAPLCVPTTWDQFSKQLTNEPDRIYKGPAHPQGAGWLPFRIPTQDFPAYAFRLAEMNREYADYIMAPFGPGSMNIPKNITSGLQQAQYLEQMQQRLRPMVESWESANQEIGRLLLRTYRNFQKIPKVLNVGGKEDGWREAEFEGADLDEDIDVIVVPYSTMPTSMVATAGMWIELAKAGVANPGDPNVQRRIWSDLRFGDMADTFPDATSDYDKAHRNIGKVHEGLVPIVTAIDDPNVHLSVYRQYMKSQEFESLDEQTRLRMEVLHDSAVAARDRLLFQQAMWQQMLAGGGAGAGGENPVQASAAAVGPGQPQGGAEAHGLGGHNIMRNSGGAPTKS